MTPALAQILISGTFNKKVFFSKKMYKSYLKITDLLLEFEYLVLQDLKETE
jgi:hypothetical protein